jgi:hypothetical protein
MKLIEAHGVCPQATDLSLYALLIAMALGAVAIGGGLYETALVDRAWPQAPQIIQPSRGGINRRLFWGPVNGLLELALLAALILAWPVVHARAWVATACLIHLTSRTSSFAYFIPNAIRFERLEPGAATQTAKMTQWVRLSRWRVAAAGGMLLALGAALVSLARP